MRFIALATLLLLGATEINAQVADGDIKITAKGGAMTASVGSLSEGKYRVTLTATPNTDYTISAKDIVVYPLVNPAAVPQRRGPGLADALAVHDGASANIFYFDLPERYHGAMVTATFQPPVTPGTYVLHNSSLTNGYLSVKGANVTLDGNSGLQYANLYDKGNAFWVITKEGYLQNNVYYLNVANNQTLYLSVNPVTQWQQEKITGDEHGKTHIKYNDLYLCNNGSSFTLKQTLTETDSYYNACPVTITEKSWSGPTNGDLTVQSPQLVAYLRYYFTQNIEYEFYNDSGTLISEKPTDGKGKSRFVYAKLEYASGGDAKGTKWDITDDGIIYNKQTSNVEVTAKYNMKPADAEALKLHDTATQKDIKLTIQPKALAPVVDMDYLLYNIKGPSQYRYPTDKDSQTKGDLLIPSGAGGTGASSVLSDPLDDGTGRNKEISWRVTVDSEGFYMFKNTQTGRYLYFDEAPHASSDYGVIRVGDTSLPTDESVTKYKFRLFKTSTTIYSVCYYIIPYSKLFAVYSNSGVASDIYAALNSYDYQSKDTKIVGLSKSNDNSKWCIYKYEAEYRVRQDFSFKGPSSTKVTGDFSFTSDKGWYGKYIKESPKNGEAQRDWAIKGKYNEDKINYIWTVTGLDDYISHDGLVSLSGGGWGVTNENVNILTINVSSLPTSTASGVISLQLRGGTQDKNSATDPQKWSGPKTMAFTILGDGTVTLTEISSLSAITSSSGTYRLTADQTYSSENKPGENASTFSGILDCDGHTITGLSTPLFTTLTNGTVRNLNLKEVSITSKSGPTGAIAGTADGGSRIYNVGILDGELSSSDNVCGGLVGQLNGSARVINCFSYANISGGTEVGGIVGYNNYESKASDIRTMVMNCMFYGDITGGNIVSPVYGGKNINNLLGGLNTFNYYSYDKATNFKSISEGDNKKYNCALAVEEKYLNRFEYYRLLLNSNKKLAAFYIANDAAAANLLAKWVLETADRSISGRDPYPYPILKAQGNYPSIINYDVEHAPDSVTAGRNKGGKLGKTLTVHIGGVGNDAPDGASIIRRGAIILPRTDKDFDRFNYNYDKVQLPYYNDVGTGNYTGNRVVTGWKITAITEVDNDPYTSANYPTTGITDYPNHNYADRKSSNKDKYDISKRVFSQGAYFDVPYGVTSITIEPYWGKACYIADANYDVVYKNDYTGKQDVGQTGTQVTVGTTLFDGQRIEATVANALKYINDNLGGLGPTVYDNAVVLMGNLHLDGVPSGGDTPFTMMSVDKDNDHEPDYSMIYHHKNRTAIAPIRFDFLNIPGTAQAQKPNTASLICNFTIFKTKGWFEVTNTSSFYTSQLEYENQADVTKSDAPLILLGGVIDQFVSTQSSVVDGHTIYIHVGGNVWINSFGLGTHSDGGKSTPHVPVSVTGGEYPGFYLTGTYNADATPRSDNAECYISGGYFHEAAGASLEKIDGDVRWQIYNADIDNFFGGGTNDAKPITGDITVDIFNSNVTLFCGGPKFGNMQTDKIVTTTAEGCTFGKFFGAGYGGTSIAKKKYYDKDGDQKWATLQGYYTTDRGKYYNGTTTGASQISGKDYGKKGPGVATDFDYEFFVWSSGATGARLFVKFASFSLAQCNDVYSTLKKCTIEESFYGGGNLGKVTGTATSVLEDCTIKGDVYGAGYSASLPTVDVRDAGFATNPNYNAKSGMFEPGVFSGTTTFNWQNATAAGKTLTNGNSGSDLETHVLYTNTVLTNLGEVAHTKLTIKGGTTVGKSVYGGGEESGVGGDTEVNVTSGTIGTLENAGGALYGNVYGGGKGKVGDKVAGYVKGNTVVNISQAENKTTTIYHNIYGGGAYGSVGDFTYDTTSGMPTSLATANTGNCTVTITGGTIGSNGKENGMVFGSSRGDVATPVGTPAVDPNDRMAWVYSTHVKIGDTNVQSSPTIKGSIYGSGENGHTFQNTIVDINKGIIGITDTSVDGGATYAYRGNVYGGGCGTDTYWIDANSNNTVDEGEKHYNPLAGIVQGTTTVNITGGHVVHNVYGAGAMGSVVGGTTTDAGKTTINVTGGRIGYDGNENGHVFGAARGEFGVSDAASNLANVRETEVNINYATTPAADNEGKTEQLIAGSVFGGGEAGTVKGSVAVKMTGGLILNDVYGGGALADTQTSNWDATNNTWANTTSKSALNTTAVRLTGGTILGEAYGGGLGEAASTNYTNGRPAYVWGDVLVDLNNNNNGGTADGTQKGCAVDQIFGCNNVNGTPKGSVTVHVFATQNAEKDNIATKFMKTNVDLSDMTIINTIKASISSLNAATQEAKTDAEKDFDAQYAIYTDENSTDAQKQAALANMKSIILLATAEELGISTTAYTDASTDAEKQTALENIQKGINANANRCDVHAVYGGGNMAAYEPVGPNPTATSDDGKNTEYSTNVIIDGCGLTSIRQVYGGGNAASTPATNLTINGTYEIEEAFGGGNGKDDLPNGDPNPGANVGFHAYADNATNAQTPKDRADNYGYGSGKASLNIYGGTIHRVFGGSNTKGNVRQTAVTMLEEVGGCDFCVDEAYGGGKSAPMDAEAKLLMACIPGLNAAYGGAEAADIQGNVSLTITNGRFSRVFGGNNLSGTIRGAIKVNVEEVGCKPIIIGELYGGGNEAGYSIYGYKQKTEGGKLVWKPRESASDNTADGECDNLTTPYADPQVNVKSFTSIGAVYGGGYGKTAVMVGNPTVNVSVVEGAWKEYVGESSQYKVEGYVYDATGYKGETITITDSDGTTTHDVELPNHAKGKIGAIGQVFGGGNAAPVKGNTTVNIGTLEKVSIKSYVEKTITEGTSLEGLGLYTRSGAGTIASPYRYIAATGTAEEGTKYYEEKNVETDVVGVDIRGNVYGGGNNAEVTGNTNVQIGKKM